ncbi:uncharacterized protein LOC124269121 [Haliotis rubra]|uniref:uncharacterized protein LOC124269121 n=1 Tax=Haliotis rubra TaxID=36100 RepID=UPI001EE53DB6|nr:uncharacterized protein LOC124269121 [Haliotis rubra]
MYPRTIWTFCQLSCIDCPGEACNPSSGICIQGSNVPVLGLGLSTGFVLLIVCTVCIFVFHFRRRRQTTERNHQRDESILTERSGQVETGEYCQVHRYWDIDDYDEVSQRQGQQRGRAEEEDYEEVSQQQRQQQGPSEEEDNSAPALPVLADYFPGPSGSDDDDGIPVPPVLADYLPGARNVEDNNEGDTLHESTSGSQSYTPLMRDVFVDDPKPVVTYISPTEDNT